MISRTKADIGEAKRKEVRFLILSGLSHAEIVKRSGIASGTVTLCMVTAPCCPAIVAIGFVRASEDMYA